MVSPRRGGRAAARPPPRRSEPCFFEMEGGNKNVVGAVSGGERRETRCRRPAAPPLLVKICFPSLPPPPVGGKQVFFFRRRERRKRFAIGAAKKKKETNARGAKSFNSSFFSVSDTISRDLKLKASDGNCRRSVSEGRTLNSSERFGKKAEPFFFATFSPIQSPSSPCRARSPLFADTNARLERTEQVQARQNNQ